MEAAAVVTVMTTAAIDLVVLAEHYAGANGDACGGLDEVSISGATLVAVETVVVEISVEAVVAC